MFSYQSITETPYLCSRNKQFVTDMSIKQDRKRHFVAGFIVAAVVSLFFGYIIGVIAAVLAVTGNEVRKHAEDKPAPA